MSNPANHQDQNRHIVRSATSPRLSRPAGCSSPSARGRRAVPGPTGAAAPTPMTRVRYLRPMRSRGLSFSGAVKLLDGDPKWVSRLDTAGGVIAGTVTIGSAGTVDFFALRDEVVRW